MNGSNEEFSGEPTHPNKFCAECEELAEKTSLNHLDETTLLRDEIRALKAETAAYLAEINSLNEKLQTQKDQDAPLLAVGRQIRLRYLEQHRRRMGINIGQGGVDCIKIGDRAAHRGRPIEDAVIYLTGLRRDERVYRDLYGLAPKMMEQLMGVEEIVEAAKFRASLQSEARLTSQFQEKFDNLLHEAAKYPNGSRLKEAFENEKTLQRCHADLQDCYDQIIAQNK